MTLGQLLISRRMQVLPRDISFQAEQAIYDGGKAVFLRPVKSRSR
jgi:hypothetical protein